MKQPQIGSIVWWLPHPHEGTPCAAIVTRSHSTNIELLILPPGYMNGMVRTGVLHKSDPNLKEQQIKDCGCWVEMPKPDSETEKKVVK
jgi:hypothetical protein